MTRTSTQHKWYLSEKQLEHIIHAMNQPCTDPARQDYAKKFGQALMTKLEAMKAEASGKNKLNIQVGEE